jgi:hypothetical protein
MKNIQPIIAILIEIIIFIMILITTCIVFFLNDYWELFFNLSPIIFIVLTLSYFLANDKLSDKLKNMKSFIYPLIIAFSISFSVFSILFSIHSEVFRLYEKSMNSSNLWYKVSAFIKFPMNQMKLNSNPEIQGLKFNNVKSNTSSSVHIILIDMTGSYDTLNFGIDKKICDSMDSVIKNAIGNNESLVQFRNIRDKLPLLLISSIKNNFFNDSSQYSLLYFDGFNHEILPVFEESHYFRKFSERIDINRYSRRIDSIKEKNEEKRKIVGESTNLCLAIQNLCKYVLNDDLNNINRIYLYIVSDFINTEPNRIDKKYLDMLYSTDKIKTINLYKLYGKQVENEKDMSEQFIQDIKVKFKTKAFVNKINLNDQNIINDEFEDIITTWKGIDNDTTIINVYYPYPDYFNSESKITSLILDLKKSCKIRIVDVGNTDNSSVDIFSSNHVSVNFNELSGQIETRDGLKLKFNDINDYKRNIFLEIFPSNNYEYKRLRLNFLPILPTSTCHFLICLFCVFMFSLFLIIILVSVYSYFFYINGGKPAKDEEEKVQFERFPTVNNNGNFWIRRLFLLPMVGMIVLLVGYFVIIWKNNDILLISFIIIFILSGIIIRFLFDDVNKLKVNEKKEKENLKQEQIKS